MAAAGAQNLLRGPQRIAPARRVHHGELGKVHAGGDKRGRIKQMRRRKPCHALADPRQGSHGRQNELELAYSFLAAQDLGERPARPAPAWKFCIE